MPHPQSANQVDKNCSGFKFTWQAFLVQHVTYRDDQTCQQSLVRDASEVLVIKLTGRHQDAFGVKCRRTLGLDSVVCEGQVRQRLKNLKLPLSIKTEETLPKQISLTFDLAEMQIRI